MLLTGVERLVTEVCRLLSLWNHSCEHPRTSLTWIEARRRHHMNRAVMPFEDINLCRQLHFRGQIWGWRRKTHQTFAHGRRHLVLFHSGSLFDQFIEGIRPNRFVWTNTIHCFLKRLCLFNRILERLCLEKTFLVLPRSILRWNILFTRNFRNHLEQFIYPLTVGLVQSGFYVFLRLVAYLINEVQSFHVVDLVYWIIPPVLVRVEIEAADYLFDRGLVQHWLGVQARLSKCASIGWHNRHSTLSFALAQTLTSVWGLNAFCCISISRNNTQELLP